MDTKIRFPLNKSTKYNFKFLDKCVYCGQPCETYLPMDFNFFNKEYAETYSFSLQVPYCTKDAKEGKRNSKVVKYTMYIGVLLIIGLIIYIIYSNISGIFGALSGTTLYELIILGVIFGGLATGILVLFFIGGYAISYIVRAVLSLFNKSYKQTPIMNGLLGFEWGFSKDEKEIVFGFSNPSIALEFEELNNQPEIQEEQPEKEKYGEKQKKLETDKKSSQEWDSEQPKKQEVPIIDKSDLSYDEQKVLQLTYEAVHNTVNPNWEISQTLNISSSEALDIQENLRKKIGGDTIYEMIQLAEEKDLM